MVKKLLLIVIITTLYFSLLPNKVFAIPTLGVATDTGIYAYTDPDAPLDEWIEYFVDIIDPAIAEYEGFVVGPSGSSLTVFTNYNPWQTSIYLLANTAGGNSPMTFGGNSLILNNGNFITGQADGYTALPYYYLELRGTVDYFWQEAPDNFPQANGPFWFYTAPITYTDKWGKGDYFFAGANINGAAGLQYAGSGMKHDDFSPKTTSAGGHTPEPATMLLFGIGILGFGIAGRKRR